MGQTRHEPPDARLSWNIGTVTYQYDPLNNLRTRGGPSPLTYSANATTNRLDSVTGGLTRSYTYNAKGQVEHDGTRDFVWNGADRIVEVVGIASYAYDGLGKRIKTTKASGAVEYTIYSRAGTLLYSYKPALSESTDYVYLGSMALAELRMAPGVLTNTDSRNPAQTVQVTLVPGRSPQVGGVVSAQVETTYLHTNLLGSPIQWSSRAATGVWLNSEHYEAYGHKLNGVGDKLGYTGHAHDFETDLTYMQARFYDPQVGRFLSTDPMPFDQKDPFTFARYTYANNNPYRYVDPTGMTAYDCSGGAGTGNCSGGVQDGDTVKLNDGNTIKVHVDKKGNISVSGGSSRVSAGVRAGSRIMRAIRLSGEKGNSIRERSVSGSEDDLGEPRTYPPDPDKSPPPRLGDAIHAHVHPPRSPFRDKYISKRFSGGIGRDLDNMGEFPSTSFFLITPQGAFIQRDVGKYGNVGEERTILPPGSFAFPE
jgi:RHS repeat-associated protein